MKRSTRTDGGTVVWRLGCPSWADLDEVGMAQLRLAHDLANELVAIQRRWEAMSDALWTSIPAVAAARTRLDEATAAFAAIEADAKARRVSTRSTVPTPKTKLLLAEARAECRAAKAELVEAKKANKPLHVAMRTELDAAKRCAKGMCTKESCAFPREPHPYGVWMARGLGHGTYTRKLDEHAAATRAIIKARKAGLPAEHRFRAWRGEGTLTVQIGYGARVCADHWALEEGRPAKEWLGRDRVVHERLNGTRRTLRLRIGRARGYGPYWLELPVIVHRPLPADAQVRWVRVTRRTVAGKPQLSAQLTLWVADVPPKATGEAVDVDLRWTSGGTAAGVRVARVSTGSGRLPPCPPDIAPLVTSGDWHEIWAPAEWRALLGRADAIRADRAELLDDLRPAVVAALSADPALADTVGFTAAAATRMAFAKYVRLARRWPAGHPLADQLASWSARDRHLWQYEANERQQTVAKRRDAWCKVADWICDAARVVAIKDVAVDELRRRPPVDAEDTHEARAARRQIQFAAPGELRTAIEHAAARRGVRIITYTGEAP